MNCYITVGQVSQGDHVGMCSQCTAGNKWTPAWCLVWGFSWSTCPALGVKGHLCEWVVGKASGPQCEHSGSQAEHVSVHWFHAPWWILRPPVAGQRPLALKAPWGLPPTLSSCGSWMLQFLRLFVQTSSLIFLWCGVPSPPLSSPVAVDNFHLSWKDCGQTAEGLQCQELKGGVPQLLLRGKVQ